MIYKISLERWGRTQYNKEQNSTPLLITERESVGQARQSHVRMLFVPSREIRIGISYQFSWSELLKNPVHFWTLLSCNFLLPGGQNLQTSHQEAIRVFQRLMMIIR